MPRPLCVSASDTAERDDSAGFGLGLGKDHDLFVGFGQTELFAGLAFDGARVRPERLDAGLIAVHLALELIDPVLGLLELTAERLVLADERQVLEAGDAEGGRHDEAQHDLIQPAEDAEVDA